MIKPFSETSLNDVGNSDPFYLTGSIDTFGTTPGDFSNGLGSKERVKVSFDVRNKTRMLPNSSSIYYFNFSSGMWNIPTRSLGDHTGPFQQVAVFTGAGYNSGSSFVEDTILFDAKGNALASGSLPIYRTNSGLVPSPNQKIAEESWNFSSRASLNASAQADLMARDYPASSQRNSAYNSSIEEGFTLPIDKPFLIEKVVFELPFCFGKGWFSDKTTLSLMTSSYGDYSLNGAGSMGGAVPISLIFDQGGPCITVALMSQKNYGTGSIRDLICKSRITHFNDTSGSINTNEIFPDLAASTNLYYFNRTGLRTGSLDTIVTPDANNFFTGSLTMRSEALISNGCKVATIAFAVATNSLGGIAADKLLLNRLSQEYTTISEATTSDAMYLYGIDPFGRGQTGFSPSGGSVFGGEYTSIDSEQLLQNGNIKNEFYVQDETLRTAIYNGISSSILTGRSYGTLYLYFFSDKFLGEERQSPYLINPGEKLVLSVSKTRPAHKNFKINVDTAANPNARTYGLPTLISSSYYNSIPTNLLPGHDVQFNTGSINITFYGSYVQNGNRYIP